MESNLGCLIKGHKHGAIIIANDPGWHRYRSVWSSNCVNCKEWIHAVAGSTEWALGRYPTRKSNRKDDTRPGDGHR